MEQYPLPKKAKRRMRVEEQISRIYCVAENPNLTSSQGHANEATFALEHDFVTMATFMDTISLKPSSLILPPS